MAAVNTIDRTQFWRQHPNPHVRLLGRDPAAGQVLAEAAPRETPPYRLDSTSREIAPALDYTQIDPALPLAPDDGGAPDPAPHTSYAGMTPVQRRRFANWLISPELAAPDAFRRLYLAWLELALFEEGKREQAHSHLAELLDAPAWQGDGGLGQTGLLAGWLAQDGDLTARGLAHGGLSPEQLTLGSGWLARLGHPLEAACALSLARGWRLHAPGLPAFSLERDEGLLQLRITSLANTLGADPLAWALEEALRQGDESSDWRPWRPVHRQVRLLVPWVDVRPALESRLAELFASLPLAQAEPMQTGGTEADGTEKARSPAPTAEWTAILEFGNSRSQHYDYVAHLARRQPGYQLLMDETRQLIHRIRFRKRHMRQFWRLWSYVENWSDVRVYVNGQEVQKWNVYPYSAEMR